MTRHSPFSRAAARAAALLLGLTAAGPGWASSHMDAPLITRDDAANTTDVYAFVSERDGRKYLSTAVSVHPFEEPGVGLNKYNFDDDVLYSIHVSLGDDVPDGRTTLSYEFRFRTEFRNSDTVLQSFVGPINDVGDPAQNLLQTYEVTKRDHRIRRKRDQTTSLGFGIVPPNNQGLATPFYNQGSDGEAPARDGVDSADELDRYTAQSILETPDGHLTFAGQRDDGFYADIPAVFDLLSLRDPGRDSQQGFNVHTIALNIPIDELGGDQQIVGVHASTQRPKVTTLRKNPLRDPALSRALLPVARQGNPLFNEGFVAIKDKDAYGRTTPERDDELFRRYAESPELTRLINSVLGIGPGPEDGRNDIAGIFIPDTIKVDLSTSAVPLAGGGADHPTNPSDPGFSPLSFLGGDTVFSPLQQTTIPSGWPNGRRFGDDVVDIALTAAASDLRVDPPILRHLGDGVDENDIAYNKVFPYAGTPHSGRNHRHDAESAGGSNGGTCEVCPPVQGFGGVPAVSVGFSIRDAIGVDSLVLAAGQSYTFLWTAFRESSVAPDPLSDVDVAVRLDDQTIATANIPELDLFAPLPPAAFSVPADIGSVACLSILVNGIVDQQFAYSTSAE